MLKTSHYNGQSRYNPYNFENHGINYVSLRVNNEQVPSSPYTPNYADDLYIREYREFFDNLGICHDDVGNAVTYDQYKNGMNLYAFDLSPDLCNGFHHHPVKQGTIDLTVHFTADLTEALTFLVMGTYNVVVEIDKASGVKVVV